MMKVGVQFPSTSLQALGASVPIGTRGLVHVWGRNDMGTNQRMGIAWIVKDPNGIVAEEHSDWEVFWTGPGNEHEFIGGRFDINKPGTWLIGISLFMNPDAPVRVDTYEGVLCVVTELWEGTISKKELEYDGTRGAIPVQ